MLEQFSYDEKISDIRFKGIDKKKMTQNDKISQSKI